MKNINKKKKLLGSIAVLLLLSVAVGNPLQAQKPVRNVSVKPQTQEASALSRLYDFDIPPGTVNEAMSRITYYTQGTIRHPDPSNGLDPDVVRCKGVKGRMTAVQAMQRVLEGTGFGFTYYVETNSANELTTGFRVFAKPSVRKMAKPS